MENKKIFISCEMCGRRLIERLPNGLWRFRFGRIPDTGDTVVDLTIYGNLQIKCFRKTCGYINTLNYFPFVEYSEEASEKASAAAKKRQEEWKAEAAQKKAEAAQKKALSYERTAARNGRVDDVCVICGEKGWWDKSTVSYRCHDHTGDQSTNPKVFQSASC